MQDDHYDTNDRVHGQGHLDDAGKPGAEKFGTPGLEGGIRKRAVMHLAGCPPYFFASLTKECTNRRRFQTRQEARSTIFESLECFYNPIRLHSTLQYQSPNAFEQAKDLTMRE
jgi:transposase InsO family protein